PAIVRDVDDKQMLFDTLTENLAREDVDPIEETRAIARAVEVMEDLTQADLAERLRTSPQQLSNRIRLLRLPDQTLELVSNGRMSWTAARDLICLVGEDHTHETELDNLIKRVGQWRHNLPARELRRYLGPTCASKPTRWRPLTDLSGVVQYAGMAVSQPPLFDVEAFKAAHPKQVHNLPDPTGTGYHAWTCAGSEWNAAQREAKK
ncbi:MAG: ParB/RepB/Spo0J family partition protein, partial [Alphaproteobacteria bacterium]|nr:ParB/RepB/Spo0J family partition protein [Alphaproteobacteria bacterium]